MARFLFLFRSEPNAHDKMTPEEMRRNQERWLEWLGEGVRKGWVVEVGDALKTEGRVVTAAKVISDGPFIESKEVVGGFTLVEAESLDAAAELAKGCPMFQPGGVGGRVEVRPLWGFALR